MSTVHIIVKRPQRRNHVLESHSWKRKGMSFDTDSNMAAWHAIRESEYEYGYNVESGYMY